MTSRHLLAFSSVSAALAVLGALAGRAEREETVQRRQEATGPCQGHQAKIDAARLGRRGAAAIVAVAAARSWLDWLWYGI